LTGITDAADATPIAGLAVDLGTTQVVLRLIDLAAQLYLCGMIDIRGKFLPNTDRSLFPSVSVWKNGQNQRMP